MKNLQNLREEKKVNIDYYSKKKVFRERIL